MTPQLDIIEVSQDTCICQPLHAMKSCCISAAAPGHHPAIEERHATANIHLAIAIHGDEAVLLPADANAPDVFSIHLGQR